MKWEDGAAGYANLWAKATIKPDAVDAVAKAVARISAGRTKYDAVAAATGVPWWFVGIVHLLEGNASFKTHLHNGDPLTARTVHKPANRPAAGSPPFTWIDSAVDALQLKDLHTERDWSIPKALWNFERYNGFGYVGHNVNSPYIWSMTNLYTRGKYVADGVWDANVVSQQVGAAAILLGMGMKAMTLSNFDTIIRSIAPTGASLLAGPLATIALRELALVVGKDARSDEATVAEGLAGLAVGELLKVLAAWEGAVAPLVPVTPAPIAAPAPAPIAAPAPAPAPITAPTEQGYSILDAFVPSLTGYKTVLGILVYVAAHVAAGLQVAPGILTPDVLGVIDTVAGGIVGVGLLAKVDRVLSLFVKK